MSSFVVSFNYVKKNIFKWFRKKKKLAAQKENISKLPKHTSVFTLKETNRQTNSLNSSSQDASSKSQSLETGPTFDIS